MVRAIKYGLVAAALLALAVGAVILFAPADRFREPLAAQVQAATGRSLTIAGSMRFTFAPEPGLSLSDVTVSAPGAAEPILVHADSVTLAVEFFPLLAGELKVTRVALDGCTITLARGAEGSANWGPAPAGGSPGFGIGDLVLSECRIAYRDDARGRAVEFTATDLRLRWPENGATLSVSGGLGLRGEHFEIDGSIGNPAGLLEGGRVPLRAQLEGTLLEGTIDGDADLGALRFEGGVNISATSTRRLAQLFGVNLPGDRGLGDLSLSAGARLSPGEAHFRDAKFTLDGMTGGGAFGLRMDGDVVGFAGMLNVDRFDLSTYLTLQEPEIEQAETGWSNAAVDFSALPGFALDIALKAHRVDLFGLSLQDADMTLSAGKGAVSLTLERAALYGGTANGEIAANSVSGMPSITVAATLTDADAGSVLPELAEIETLTGRVTLKLGLRGTGASQAELVKTLAGTAEITLRDGTLSGVDLAAIAGSVAQPAGFPGIGDDQATNFSSFAARFDIAGGIARTDNLSLIGPFIRIQGRGAVGLPARLMQITLSPRFVTDPDNQQGDHAPGFAMPFVVTGPFRAPIYVPDYSELADRLARGELTPDQLGALPQPLHDWILSMVENKTSVPGPPPLPGTGRAEP